MQDFRQIVKKAMGDKTVYSLAKESSVPEPALRKWLSGHQVSISSVFLERCFNSLGIQARKK